MGRHRTPPRYPTRVTRTALGAVIAVLIAAALAGLTTTPAPPPAAAKHPTTTPDTTPTVTVPAATAWALANTVTGKLLRAGGDTTGRYTTESMVKPWLAADDLTRHPHPTPAHLATISRMIRDSDDAAAQQLYETNGATDTITRLTAVCHLTDTTTVPGWWSLTRVTAADAARIGVCLTTGAAAGPTWTPWILNEMRHLRAGRWGITAGLDTDNGVAVKNGWTLHVDDNTWHIACLAITGTWSLAVLMVYPATLGLTRGADTCASVAHQLGLHATGDV